MTVAASITTWKYSMMESASNKAGDGYHISPVEQENPAFWGLCCWCNEDKVAIQISVTIFFQIQFQDFCFLSL